jgi:uncharacterized membrane protein
MTATAIFCFVAIVLGATLRAFGPRRARGDVRPPRRAGAGLVLGGPVPTLDLGPGRGRPAHGRIVPGR